MMKRNNDELNELMQMAKTELSSEGFEDRVMDSIDRLELELGAAKRSQRYALIFLIAAAFLGIAVTFIFAETISVINLTNGLKDTIHLLTYLIYVILIIVISEKTTAFIQHIKQE